VDKDTEIGFSITGSADQNEDYELSASSIVIPAGETTGSITITAIADDLYDESDEVIELAPVYISGAVPAYDTLLSITIKNDLPVYTVTYSADESAAGYIIGQKEQSIAYGEDTLPVFAVANPGYIFTGWSDSKTSNPRVDSNVISDLNIEAIFEKVAPKLFNILGKIIGVWTGGKLSGADKHIQNYLGLALFPQAGIAIGLSLSLQNQAGFEVIAPIILNVIIATTMVHEFIGPMLTKYVLKKSGECNMDRTIITQ